MRILFVGNQGNTGYRFVKWLRSEGVDARLIFPANYRHQRSLPEWENPVLKGDYPEWIMTYQESRYPYLIPNRRLKKEARQYDLVLTTGFHTLPALSLKKPVVLLPVGRELSQMPFWSDRLVQELHSYIYRRRAHRISLILTDQEDCLWAGRLLGLADRVIRYPFLIDQQAIENNVNKALEGKLQERYGHYEAIFLHPTRKNMDSRRVDYKGGEKLLKAYRRFLDRNGTSKVLMVSGLHGLETDRFRAMAMDLQLEDHIQWVGHLSLPDLHAWFSLRNVAVFDQFGPNLNALSGIQREAMAFGRPVVSSTDTGSREFQQAYGPDCPMIPAFGEQEILEAMHRITNISGSPAEDDSSIRREWIRKYVDYRSRIDELVQMLSSICSKGGERA
jgi:glycosyltransferase involved in cell wall biosynthesis